jgi:hypothetical protein
MPPKPIQPGAGPLEVAERPPNDRVLTLVYDGETFVLPWSNMPTGEKRAVKVQTGLTLGAWMDDISDVTICVIWWLCRRARGEVNLHYLQAEAEFEPEKCGEVDFGPAEASDDAPESSGP